jgi:hypothetical protein
LTLHALASSYVVLSENSLTSGEPFLRCLDEQIVSEHS